MRFSGHAQLPNISISFLTNVIVHTVVSVMGRVVARHSLYHKSFRFSNGFSLCICRIGHGGLEVKGIWNQRHACILTQHADPIEDVGRQRPRGWLATGEERAVILTVGGSMSFVRCKYSDDVV